MPASLIALSWMTVAMAQQVSWSDGDSGRLAGGTRFRLHGMDAPELSRPECLAEKLLARKAKTEAESMTAGHSVKITRRYYKDRYGRLVIDLAVDDRDIAQSLIERGVARAWDYDGGTPKPDWCGTR